MSFWDVALLASNNTMLVSGSSISQHSGCVGEMDGRSKVVV